MKSPSRNRALRAIAVLLSLFLSGCAAVMTGPRISAEDEKALQARLLADAREWQQKMEGKINEVGACLRTAAGNRLRVKFHFVGGIEQARGRMHPDAVNAWTDGQSIWITRGMMRFLKSEDELAIVLAHEPAHAARGHMGAKHAKKALSVLLGPASGIGMLLVNAATREYEKDQEREADLYGLVWAHKAGFNVDGATDLLKRMAVKAPESLSGGFLSHHPTSAERLPALDKVAQSLKKGLDPLIIFRSQESKKQSAT